MTCKVIEHSCLQYNAYMIGRILAVFLIAPMMYLRGKKYNDKFIMGLAIFLVVWDGVKVFFPKWYKFFEKKK